MYSSMQDPDDRGPDLAWLSDEPPPAAAPNDPARWPTAAQEMEGLPGFILDDDRELVPVGGAGADPPPVQDVADGLARASGQRVRLAFTWGRATAVAGVVAGMLVTTAVVYGELGLQPRDGSGSNEPPAASAPTPATPGAVDTEAIARLNDAIRTAQRRDRRIAAVRREKRRAASAKREERRPARSAPAQTAQPVAETASPPVAASPPPVAAPTPVADPWADVPGAVREFEPGPWNLGGSAS